MGGRSADAEDKGDSLGDGADGKRAGGDGTRQEPGRKHPGKRSLGSFLAGALSGTLMGATLQPFDVIRTYMQVQAVPAASQTASTSAARAASALAAPAASSAAASSAAASSAAASSAAASAAAATAGAASAAGAGPGLSMVDAARQIVGQYGLRGLWRGVGPTCVRIGLGAGIYFATLDLALEAARRLQLLARTSSPPGPQAPRPTRGTPQLAARSGRGAGSSQDVAPTATFFAGMASRSLAVVLLNPVTVVKTRMEMTGPASASYSGTVSGIMAIARTEGAAGLFRGLAPTWARDAPYSGLYLVIYSQLRSLFMPKDPHDGQQSKTGMRATAATFAAGAMAGALATLLTHPPDVVRTRLQLNLRARGGAVAPSFFGVASAIWQENGASGFFRGVTPRVVKRSLQQALGWAVFERTSRALTGRTIWDKARVDKKDSAAEVKSAALEAIEEEANEGGS